MTHVPESDGPFQASAPTPKSAYIASSKRRQIIATVDLVQRILNAARDTGGDTIHEHVQTNLPHGCLILSHDQLPARPPNPVLVAKETRLQKQLAEIAQKTIALRHKAMAVLLERARQTAHAAVSRVLTNPTFSKPSDRVNHTSLYNKASLSNAKPVDAAVDRITSLPPIIQKTRQQATNTKEKLSNIHKVLAQLKDNTFQQVTAATTPTVNADWTVNVKDSLNTPGYSSPTIPERPSLINDNDADETLASPFVTPRSKARKRAARSIYGLNPIRFQLPR